MLTRLRPWQGAAVVTAVLVAAQVVLLLLTPVSAGPGTEAPASLSPRSSEVAMGVAAPIACFAVVWLVLSVVAHARHRRDEARTPDRGAGLRRGSVRR